MKFGSASVRKNFKLYCIKRSSRGLFPLKKCLFYVRTRLNEVCVLNVTCCGELASFARFIDEIELFGNGQTDKDAAFVAAQYAKIIENVAICGVFFKLYYFWVNWKY